MSSSLYPSKKWFTDGNQPPRTLFGFSKAPSTNRPPNARGVSSMISARKCYALHGMLVMIHVVLLIFSISHWEHRAVLPFTPTNNDFWPVVLSASLQAFYTIYTGVLLFLTQRLAISRTLVRRLKLTSIHDISGAWSGLGSALSSVWQQTDIPASWWTTSAVATYLACISVLHVTSSTLLQFETFNTTMSISVPTALGWRDDLFTNVSDSVNWGTITASLPAVNQLPGLVSAGLSNNVIYDVPRTNSLVGNATVNATTITSRCELLPNITYSINTSQANGDFATIAVASHPWSDQIQVLEILGYGGNNSQAAGNYQPGVFLMISTGLEVEASLRDQVSIPTTWEYFNPSTMHSMNESVPYNIEVYFVQCSLSATTAPVMVDMEKNTLRNPVPISQPSTQWEMYQWTLESNTWQVEVGQILATPANSGLKFEEYSTGNTSNPSIVDEYMMSLVGLNLTAQWLHFSDCLPPVSNATLTPDKLESAVAQATAQVIWIAGQIGSSNGGLDIGNGTADAIQEIIALRLNVNFLPLMFAASASVIMLGLALYMTRANASHDTQTVIPNTGALQLLWLGSHSVPIHDILEDVEDPTDVNLRRAGMADVCFGKTTSDEEDRLSVRSSTDSLSGEVGHDDRMRHFVKYSPPDSFVWTMKGPSSYPGGPSVANKTLRSENSHMRRHSSG